MFRVSYGRREEEGKRGRWRGSEGGKRWWKRRRKEEEEGGGGGGMEERSLPLRPSLPPPPFPPPPSLPHFTLSLTADPGQPVRETLERERTPSTVLAAGGARCAAV